jgi:hypothetical protein
MPVASELGQKSVQLMSGERGDPTFAGNTFFRGKYFTAIEHGAPPFFD